MRETLEMRRTRYGGKASRKLSQLSVLTLIALAPGACGDSDEAGADVSDVSDVSNVELDGVAESGPEVALPTACILSEGAAPPASLGQIGCRGDFDALASAPMDTSIPGGRSVKVVFDRQGGDALYFIDSARYPMHHDFVAARLSGGGLPLVGSLADFNATEYFVPDRRFLLASITYYDGPDAWALEIAPYDTASPAMITTLIEAVSANTYFGGLLVFHPTSEAVTLTASSLPSSIGLITTDQIYAGIDYQPLNLANAIGRLRFMSAAELTTTYVSYRDIVVLDAIPNDISVVVGIITQAFQTPLSHINILSQNRKTPNMALRDAMTNSELRALDGKWVELVVGAEDWYVREATSDEADAWWETHRPTPIVLPDPDLETRDLRDIADVTPELAGQSLRDAIKAAIRTYGGKAAHYSILYKTPGLPVRPAFAIPGYYYAQFMTDNGLYDALAAMQADPSFQDDPAVRDLKLSELRDDMMAAPVDAGFQALLKARMEADFPGQSLRFRSSTNSEDLDGFPCAGCYESHTGKAGDWNDVLDAIRETWSSIFLFRTYEERSYNGVDHFSVVMPLLVHRNFPDEEANGVALTANPFDSTGLQPGFYINVQRDGDNEVVHPEAGTTSDELVYQYDQPGQPASYLTHSSLVPDGTTVLSTSQLYELGTALSLIHSRFSPAYGPANGNEGWYAMDVEFKFDDDGTGGVPTLWVKQARPHPGRGQ